MLILLFFAGVASGVALTCIAGFLIVTFFFKQVIQDAVVMQRRLLTLVMETEAKVPPT